MQALTFALKNDTFAVPIESIKELIELPQLTSVPMMPAFLRGVMNLRGAVIPVIDLAERFGLPPSEPTRRTCVVIFELASSEGRKTLGVMVDAVHEVLEIDSGRIDPPPQFGSHVAPAFLLGMARLQHKIVLLLDIEQVLSVQQLEALVAATTH